MCSRVRPPSREAEDARRRNRERDALLAERIRHANRIKGLLAAQGETCQRFYPAQPDGMAGRGVFGFEPMLQHRRTRLAALRTPEGAGLPPRLLAEIGRQMERLELAIQQLAALEAERDAAFAAERVAAPLTGDAGERPPEETVPSNDGPGARLLRLKGVGPETAAVLAGEAFFRDFRNRREVASYAGLAPSPWQSGGVDHEQGISKAGNARAQGHGATGLAVAAQPAGQCPEHLVSRPGP